MIGAGAKERTGTAEDLFLYLPQTKRAVAALPPALQEAFSQHVRFIKDAHKYLGETGPKHLRVNGSDYSVIKYTRETGERFTFSTENTEKREIIELQTDSASHSKIEYLEVSSWCLNGGGDVSQKVWTEFDLGRPSRGLTISQHVDSMTAGSAGLNRRQIFNLTTVPLLAQLYWVMNEAEYRAVTINNKTAIVHCETGLDFQSGLSTILTPVGNFYLPSADVATTDDFLSTAIMQAANLQPIQLRSVVH